MHQNRSGWQNAHEVAARSLCIVLSSKPVLKSWPFVSGGGVERQAQRADAAPLREAHPVGNTGITSEATK